MRKYASVCTHLHTCLFACLQVCSSTHVQPSDYACVYKSTHKHTCACPGKRRKDTKAHLQSSDGDSTSQRISTESGPVFSRQDGQHDFIISQHCRHLHHQAQHPHDTCIIKHCVHMTPASSSTASTWMDQWSVVYYLYNIQLCILW